MEPGGDRVIADIVKSRMSYEFHLSHPDIDRSDESQEQVDPEAEARKQQWMDAIVKLNPHLEPFVFNHEAIATSLGITVDEARQRWRHIELNGPDDGNGIQIILRDTHATISVPYWHSGEAGEAAMREIWGYLKLLNDIAGLAAFDPQLGRPLELDRDMDVVLRKYAQGISALDSTD